MKFVITAGPTREHLDPVRFLSNPSTGKMGFALAAEAARRGHEVTLVAGPVALKTPKGVRRVDVVSARDMLAAVEKELGVASGSGESGFSGESSFSRVARDSRDSRGSRDSRSSRDSSFSRDTSFSRDSSETRFSRDSRLGAPETVLVATAAVADWRPAKCAAKKLKKGEMSPTLRLVRTPDILKTINRTVEQSNNRTIRLVGFAAETNDVLAEAARKCREKGLAFIVANDVTQRGCGFGTDTNQVTFVFPDGTLRRFPLMTKRMVARRIIDESTRL